MLILQGTAFPLEIRAPEVEKKAQRATPILTFPAILRPMLSELAARHGT